MKKRISVIILVLVFCISSFSTLAKQDTSSGNKKADAKSTVSGETADSESEEATTEEITDSEDDSTVSQDIKTEYDSTVEEDTETEEDSTVDEDIQTEEDSTVDEATETDEDSAKDENGRKISKEDLEAKKAERAAKKAETFAEIKDLKSQFKDADKEGKKAILSQIAEAKRELKDTSIGVFVSGRDIDFDRYDGVKPVIKENRTLIPIRAITEAMGADVQWDSETKEITITKNETTIVLKIDEKTATVNGEEVSLDVAPTIEKNRTLVPIRFISEALELNVEWDADSQTVVIEDDTDTQADDDIN